MKIQSEWQAWKVSIAKWMQLHQLCKEGKLVEDGGRGTCGLCSLYFYGYEEECEQCPIREAGHAGCAGTPGRLYVQAVKAGDLAGATTAAAEEIKFLKELSHGSGL